MALLVHLWLKSCCCSPSPSRPAALHRWAYVAVALTEERVLGIEVKLNQALMPIILTSAFLGGNPFDGAMLSGA